MNYWVVGATWGNRDMESLFYKLKCWKMGWKTGKYPDFDNLVSQIQKEDRIAIKRMDGFAATTVCIRAIGIVTGIQRKRVCVNWLLTGLERHVPSKGCFKTIHPPVKGGDEWTNAVFSI